jgi:hypothetical protein
LVNVTADLVRDRSNLTENDVADEKVIKMIEDATATIEVETGLTIDYANCGEAEAVAIKNLAAIYLLCLLTGGSAAGLSFSVGDLHVDALNKSPCIH